MQMELTREQAYYLEEILLHEWYNLKGTDDKELLQPFLDTFKIPDYARFANWDEFLDAVRSVRVEEVRAAKLKELEELDVSD